MSPNDIFKEYRMTSDDRRAEANLANIEEAFVLLDLINAEFQSDPMSTQCFDSRIVQRVKACITKRQSSDKTLPNYFKFPR
jgi:hypothetical protein